jgi:hypothetical protein
MAFGDIKIRRSWGPISPITKIKRSDKNYNRKKIKAQARKEYAYA